MDRKTKKINKEIEAIVKHNNFQFQNFTVKDISTCFFFFFFFFFLPWGGSIGTTFLFGLYRVLTTATSGSIFFLFFFQLSQEPRVFFGVR